MGLFIFGSLYPLKELMPLELSSCRWFENDKASETVPELTNKGVKIAADDQPDQAHPLSFVAQTWAVKSPLDS